MLRHVTIVRSKDIVPKELGSGLYSKRLITGPKDGCNRFMLSLLRIEPGASSKGKYEDKDEAIYVLRGILQIIGLQGRVSLNPGDVVFIPADTVIELSNEGPVDVEALAVIAPSKTEEEL